MPDLVFLAPNHMHGVPFTTSEVIAERAEVSHHAVQQLISKNVAEVEIFGKLAFEMRPLPNSKTGQRAKIYHLTEEQSTFVISMLQNTPVVIRFKVELVKAFYAMKTELHKREVARAAMIQPRKTLTDIIKEFVPDSPHKQFAYKQYTDLIYKKVLGKRAADIRKERGAPTKAIAVDYLTAVEMDAVARTETQVGALITLGYDYAAIKSLLSAAPIRSTLTA